MYSVLTPLTTVTTDVSYSSGVMLVEMLLLLVLLICKDVINSASTAQLQRLSSVLNIVLIPLIVVFFTNAVVLVQGVIN